jgi:hypothetical protein
MRTGEALHRKWSLCCDQNTDFLARQVGANQLVKWLKHESRAKLGNRAKYVDTPAARPLHLLSNAKIAMERVRGFGSRQNR